MAGTPITRTTPATVLAVPAAASRLDKEKKRVGQFIKLPRR